MNVYEMEGFLRGKCLPGDLLVGESHAAYLVRKLNESATLKADRDAQQKRADALAVENARYSMSAGQADQRMAESRAVRASLGFNPDAEDVSPSDLVEAINQLTAELCVIRTAHPQPLGPAMDAAIDAFNAEEMPETGMLNAYFIMRDSIRVETPVTDAALEAIRLEAKIEGANELAERIAEMHSKTAPGSNIEKKLMFAAEAAIAYANGLREAK